MLDIFTTKMFHHCINTREEDIVEIIESPGKRFDLDWAVH
jgi:hypothetical protein